MVYGDKWTGKFKQWSQRGGVWALVTSLAKQQKIFLKPVLYEAFHG